MAACPSVGIHEGIFKIFRTDALKIIKLTISLLAATTLELVFPPPPPPHVDVGTTASSIF
jgi:hypothetical protein